MQGKRILILRYGAYGDHLYCLPLYDYLKNDLSAELHLHTNPKGHELFRRDPRFHSISVFDPFSVPAGRKRNRAIDRQWKQAIRDVSPDEIINLSHTLENTGVATRDVPELFDASLEERRKFLGERFFYAIPLDLCNINPHLLPEGSVGTLAYSDRQIEWARKWRASHQDQFVVLLALGGTTAQKRFPIARELGEKILDRYPDAVLYLSGDFSCTPFTFHNGRVYNAVSMVSTFKQVLLMARYSDFVVGPETGLLVGAGMWGTPKTMLCTSSSVFQCTHKQKNDFSLQADIPCSPCMRGIYKNSDCLAYRKECKDRLPPCNFQFDPERILDGIDLVYRQMRYLSQADEVVRTAALRVPVLRPDLVECPGQKRPLQPGVPAQI